MSSPPIRVAIVNDYDLVVAGVASLLEPFGDRVEVVEVDAGVPVRADVDVVLFDTFGQAEGEGLDIDELLGHNGDARLLIFSWNCDDTVVRQAIKAGASGVLGKDATADLLVEAIEQVHAGEQVVPAGEFEGEPAGRWPGEQHGLSAREAEVLALICQGLSNQEITERAFLGMNTIKSYIRTLYRKIQVGSRTQAVLWGLEHGFEPDRRRERPGA